MENLFDRLERQATRSGGGIWCLNKEELVTEPQTMRKLHRFESCPDHGVSSSLPHGIRSVKPENLLDSLERQATRSGGGMVDAL